MNSRMIQSIVDSDVVVRRYRDEMEARGCHMLKPPLKVCPAGKDPRYYSDGGDLFMIKKIEVKARSLNFTSRDDFPFSSLIVDEVDRVDVNTPADCSGYCIVSGGGRGSHFAFIPMSTKRFWIKRSNRDQFTGAPRLNYECPVEHIIFSKFRHAIS